MMEPKRHWEEIYGRKAPTQVSWYQPQARRSLHFIAQTGIDKTAPIIDVGGGAATLVDDLLTAGFQRITVLDISAAALQLAQARLGARATAVTWLEADVTQVALPHRHYEVWHDRAVFHFLTQAADRQRYVAAVRRAVKPGGHVIVATFAPDGPTHCSGLPVARYSPHALHGAFGDDFQLVSSSRENHQTPSGAEQRFVYCYCRKLV